MSSTANHRVLIVGAGVNGLRTTIELLRRGCKHIVLRSACSPKHTCSYGAGGLWMPFHPGGNDNDNNYMYNITKWSFETLDELLSLHKKQEQLGTSSENKNVEKGGINNDNIERRPLVEIVPTIALHRDKSTTFPDWTKDSRIKFQHLTLEMLQFQNQIHNLRLPPTSISDLVHNVGYHYAWLFFPPIVDAPNMLQHMLNEILSYSRSSSKNNDNTDKVTLDIDIETGYEYKSIGEMVDDAKKLNCNSIVNCTGMGSASMLKGRTDGDSSDLEEFDDQLIGARGILLEYDRNDANLYLNNKNGDGKKDPVILIDEEPWGSEIYPCYIIPRGNVVVVGGSYLEGEDTSAVKITSNERQRLVDNATILGINTKNVKPINEWTGFRPYRKTGVRCELDNYYTGKGNHDDNHIRVIHNYGHGGSGWTIYVGTAKESANLVCNTG